MVCAMIESFGSVAIVSCCGSRAARSVCCDGYLFGGTYGACSFFIFESFCIEISPGTVFLPGDVVVCCVFYSVC